MGWDSTRWYQIFSIMYRQTSFCLDRMLWKKIVDTFECARMTEHPVISLGDLNFNYILDETLSTNPIHYIETTYDMRQLIDQHEWMIKPSLCRMSFVRPIQRFIVGVQSLNIHLVTTILFTLRRNLKIPNHQWLITTLWNFVTWKVSMWRVSPMISFHVTFEMVPRIMTIYHGKGVKLTYTDICDKHAPMKSLRLKYDPIHGWPMIS